MDRNEVVFDVSVDIIPRWIVPPKSESERMRRTAIEVRFAAFAHELRNRIRAGLVNWQETKDEDMNKWILPLPGDPL